MEAQIGIGYGKIRFGMRADEAEQLLGAPDKTRRDETGLFCQYNSAELVLFFDDEEGGRLYAIEVYDDALTLFSEKIIGMSRDALKQLMAAHGCKEFEYQDYDFFDTLYFDGINATFQFQFDRVSSMEFSPLFKEGDDDVILWP